MSLAIILNGNPIVPWIIAILTFTIAVGFTGPKSPLRILGLIVMFYTLWNTYIRLQAYRFDHAFYSNFLGGSSCSIVMKYIEWALLSRWSFEARGPTSGISGIKPVRVQPRGASSLGKSAFGLARRFEFGIGTCWDERLTHTPWQVKGTPGFDVSRFYTDTLAAILFNGLILDLMGLGADNRSNAENFSYRKVPFFSRLDVVTGEEVAIRIIGTIMWWAASYWLLQVLYNVSALVLVATGLSRPERWAPPFGRILDCWSIRQFWGSFWQQAMRRKLTGLTHFTLQTLLGLPQKGLFVRYASLTMVFFWSGVAHIVANLNNAIPYPESGAFRFYMTQAVGIIIEDAFQHVWRLMKGRKRDDTPPKAVERAFGLTWTFLWLVWTTPGWAFPSMARSPDGPILPVSILGMFVNA